MLCKRPENGAKFQANSGYAFQVHGEMIFKIFNSFASNKFKTLKTTYNNEAILKWGDVT